MEVFKVTSSGFNYVYEKTLTPNQMIILKMPVVTSNKRGFNDIGWQAKGNVDLYGTLAISPEREDTIWQKIEPYDEINKTVSALKIVNGDAESKIVIRALLN